jgi:hypothetical protein
MKRTWLLAALFLLLGAGAYYTLKQKNQKASTVSTDMDFSVDNFADVTKIFIANRDGETATLERKSGFWLYNGKFKARAGAMEVLIETLTKLKVSYLAPKSADNVMVKNIAANGITLELWNKDDKRIRRYYVGGVTNDERGTYAIMEGSEQPYVVHIPGFTGTVRGRFLIGDDNWRDRNIFSEDPESIQSVSVDYPMQKSQSFKLERTGKGAFSVTPFYPTTLPIQRPVKKGIPESYLIQFEKKGAEGFETNNVLRDSVIHLVPFATILVKKTDGTEKKVKFYPVEIEHNTTTGASYVSRFFAECGDNQDFLSIQDRVFGPIFRGYGYFFEGVDESVQYKN